MECGGDRENSAMSFIFNTSKAFGTRHSAAFHTRCRVSSSWLDVAINCNDMVSSNHFQLHCDFIQSIFSLSFMCVYVRFCVCPYSHKSRSPFILFSSNSSMIFGNLSLWQSSENSIGRPLLQICDD